MKQVKALKGVGAFQAANFWRLCLGCNSAKATACGRLSELVEVLSNCLRLWRMRYREHTAYPRKLDMDYAETGPGTRKGLNIMFLRSKIFLPQAV
jgi:hypothetical protein